MTESCLNFVRRSTVTLYPITTFLTWYSVEQRAILWDKRPNISNNNGIPEVNRVPCNFAGACASNVQLDAVGVTSESSEIRHNPIKVYTVLALLSLEWFWYLKITHICHFYFIGTGVIKRLSQHDDVIKWKHFPRYWPFVRGIHRSLVNSPHKGQWRGALMFFLSAHE